MTGKYAESFGNFIKRMQRDKYNVYRTVKINRNIKGKAMAMTCDCGYKALTRGDMNIHMIIGCPKFSRFII